MTFFNLTEEEKLMHHSRTKNRCHKYTEKKHWLLNTWFRKVFLEDVLWKLRSGITDSQQSHRNKNLKLLIFLTKVACTIQCPTK